MKPNMQIAVRALVEHVLRSGDLDREFVGSARALEGIRAHQKLQKSRPPGYEAEVVVTCIVEDEKLRLAIGGRIDGVFVDGDCTVVEEIKTTTRDLDRMVEGENPVHWAQAKSYACMLAAERGLAAVDVQLTYVQLDSGRQHEIRRCFPAWELTEFFQDLIARYLHWVRRVAVRVLRRNASAEALRFPFSHYRPGQRRMAVAVYRSLQNHTRLMVQAPTGIGKTMAALFPAVKSFGRDFAGRIYFLTARTTGRQAAEKALEILRAGGLEIKSLSLTAKDKVCFQPQAGCTPEECPYARGHYDRLPAAMEALFEHDAFTRQALDHLAREHRVCPFEYALDLLPWIDCVICDYNYAFDPRVRLRRLEADPSADGVYLVDEAHNLLDRSREMFSAALGKQRVLEVRRPLRTELPGIYRLLGAVNRWMLKARKSCQDSEACCETAAPENLYPLLKDFSRAAEKWLARNLRTPYRQAVLELFFDVGWFLRVLELFDDTYVTCYERREKELRVELYCLDPAPQLAEALAHSRAAIFFSATLTPAGYFQQVLGLGSSAAWLRLNSPFPRRNLRLYVAERISTYYRQRTLSRDQVAGIIASFVQQKTGNYLVFFPSYEYLEMVRRRFCRRLPQATVVVQQSGMTESERETFVRRFESRPQDTLVGFAVMGGIFGEGIDLVGEHLSGAAVVGVGLPAVSPRREEMRRHYADGGSGFEYAYVYPGINRVLQAAGRVIRSEHDRGAVLLVDRRFSTRRYRELFPESWQPIPVRHAGDLERDLRGFWKSDTDSDINPGRNTGSLRSAPISRRSGGRQVSQGGNHRPGQREQGGGDAEPGR